MEKKHRVWGLSVLCLGVLCLVGASPAEIAYAASPEGAVTEIMGGLSGGGAGFGSTFTNQLGGMSKSLLTAAKLIAVIMTAAAGCMVCFGIQDSRTAFWNWILGIGLAINFGDLLLNLWGVESVSAPPKIATYDLLLKSESDPTIDILSPFMRYYIGIIMQGAAAVVPYAINLTLILALIDGSIRLAFDLVGGDKVKFLVTTVLKVGFFIFLIHSWVGTNSNYQLMPALSSGFETMGYTAGGAQDMITEYVKGNPDSNIEVQSNQIVTNALNFFNIFWESASQKNLLTILVGLVCVVAAVIILFLTALEMFMVRIEFWTMALITIPLLPFGVIDKLKFLSDKAIGAMFNLAIKIFVIAFLSTMSVNILTGLVENAKAASTSADFMGNISYFLQVLLYALILFFLTKKIPALVSGLLSGNPSLGGMDMKQLATSAAKGAAGAVAKGAGAAGLAYGGMKALSQAAGPMKAWGGKDSIGANALSFAGAAGDKAMSMMGQAASAGVNALKTRNPAYQGYQRGMSLLGNQNGKMKNAGMEGKGSAGTPAAGTGKGAGTNDGRGANTSPSGNSFTATQPQGMVGNASSSTPGNGQRMSDSPDLQKTGQSPTMSAAPSPMSRNGAMAETSATNGNIQRMAGQTTQVTHSASTPQQSMSHSRQDTSRQAQRGNSPSRPESIARPVNSQPSMMDTGRPASSMLSRDGSADKKNSGRGDRRRRD